MHDFTKDYDSTIIHIINGHLSGRKVGDCPSSFFFEHLVDGEIKMDDKPVYFNTTQKGKMLKSSTTFLRNKHNKIIGSVCINFDVTSFFDAQSLLNHFLNYEEQKIQENEILVSNVGELLEYYLIQCEKEIGKPAVTMNKEEKMKALEAALGQIEKQFGRCFCRKSIWRQSSRSLRVRKSNIRRNYAEYSERE